jgi:hypothetical protein
MNEGCVSLDYERAYEEYLAKYHQLMEKHAALELDLKNEREKRMMLEAQMEVVRLIFGGDGK